MKIFSLQNLPWLDKHRLTYRPPSPMPPCRASGGCAGAIHSTCASSMTTWSRVQAGPSATATTSQELPTPVGNVGMADDEPLPIYLGPAQQNPGNNPSIEDVPAYPSSPRTVLIPPTPPVPSGPQLQSAVSDNNTEVLSAI